jgi:hypothetical protein
MFIAPIASGVGALFVYLLCKEKVTKPPQAACHAEGECQVLQ